MNLSPRSLLADMKPRKETETARTDTGKWKHIIRNTTLRYVTLREKY